MKTQHGIKTEAEHVLSFLLSQVKDEKKHLLSFTVNMNRDVHRVDDSPEGYKQYEPATDMYFHIDIHIGYPAKKEE